MRITLVVTTIGAIDAVGATDALGVEVGVTVTTISSATGVPEPHPNR
jgi:hypothetical protein